MWSLKYGTDEPVCEVETGSVVEARLVPEGQGIGAGDWGCAVSGRKPFCVEWITARSTAQHRDDVQNPEANCHGREYEVKCV